MKRTELEQACQPQTPEQALDGLRVLYNALAHSTWAEGDDLKTVNSAIEITKLAIADSEREAQLDRINEQLGGDKQ